MNVDVVIPTSLAKMVSEELDAMVLPPIVYGYKSHPASGGGQLFPGTTSLDGATLINLTLDILRETYRHGGRRFLILNGHYENVAFVTEAVELTGEIVEIDALPPAVHIPPVTEKAYPHLSPLP